MRTPTLLLLVALAALTAACGPSDDDDSAPAEVPPTHGTLAVSFALDEDYAAEMDEPAIGSFWGSIYDAEQVSGIGPDDDAVELGSIYVELVDLTNPELTSAVLFVTEPLEARWVTILGFLDSDANSLEDDRDPDDGDPVTLPHQNEHLVVAGEEIAAEVFFGFLNP